MNLAHFGKKNTVSLSIIYKNVTWALKQLDSGFRNQADTRSLRKLLEQMNLDIGRISDNDLNKLRTKVNNLVLPFTVWKDSRYSKPPPHFHRHARMNPCRVIPTFYYEKRRNADEFIPGNHRRCYFM